MLVDRGHYGQIAQRNRATRLPLGSQLTRVHGLLAVDLAWALLALVRRDNSPLSLAHAICSPLVTLSHFLQNCPLVDCHLPGRSLAPTMSYFPNLLCLFPRTPLRRHSLQRHRARLSSSCFVGLATERAQPTGQLIGPRRLAHLGQDPPARGGCHTTLPPARSRPSF